MFRNIIFVDSIKLEFKSFVELMVSFWFLVLFHFVVKVLNCSSWSNMYQSQEYHTWVRIQQKHEFKWNEWHCKRAIVFIYFQNRLLPSKNESWFRWEQQHYWYKQFSRIDTTEINLVKIAYQLTWSTISATAIATSAIATTATVASVSYKCIKIWYDQY